MDLRGKIFSAVDLKTERVDVPEWGVTVYVRTLSGAQRDEFEQGLQDSKSEGAGIDIRGLKARLAVLATVDDDGEAVFQPGDEEALQNKSAAPLDRLYQAASRLSGLSPEDAEELVGNSASGQSDDSGSA